MKYLIVICILFIFFGCSDQINETRIIESFGVPMPKNYEVTFYEKKEAIGDTYIRLEIKINDANFQKYFDSWPGEKMPKAPQGDYFLYKNKNNKNEYLTINKESRKLIYIYIDE